MVGIKKSMINSIGHISMGSEDDTFRVLKRPPLIELVKKWDSTDEWKNWTPSTLMLLDSRPFKHYLEHNGWSLEEYQTWIMI